MPMSSGGVGRGGLASQGSNRIDYVMRATVKSNNSSWGAQGPFEPPNISNYTLIKEALAQHSRQKRKAMGAVQTATAKKAGSKRHK